MKIQMMAQALKDFMDKAMQVASTLSKEHMQISSKVT
jgi:hypothetical protein